MPACGFCGREAGGSGNTLSVGEDTATTASILEPITARAGVVLLIVAWIGYTLATTPPLTPLEDWDINNDEEPPF